MSMCLTQPFEYSNTLVQVGSPKDQILDRSPPATNERLYKREVNPRTSHCFLPLGVPESTSRQSPSSLLETCTR
ncbi:unnamed protein product [Nezara viridula]|uniref:Uncharacterized protein n=1 Tax=Nezara viridula TaxID=85310 RepID=A0A9P0E847_NEZVI|nr:unnamed protein product [Nezara viridula]